MFLREPRPTIVQRNAQEFLHALKLRGIAAGRIAHQFMSKILLSFRRVTLADNVGGGTGLQFEHADSQHDRERREQDQRSKLKRKHAQRRALMLCDRLRCTGKVAGSRVAGRGHAFPSFTLRNSSGALCAELIPQSPPMCSLHVLCFP